MSDRIGHWSQAAWKAWGAVRYRFQRLLPGGGSRGEMFMYGYDAGYEAGKEDGFDEGLYERSDG